MDFNIESANWDSRVRKERAKAIAEQIAQTLSLKSYFSALEFGCGTGLISFSLTDRLKDITCVDISKGMIATLQSKIQEQGINNMKAYHCDILIDEILKPRYDLIYELLPINRTLLEGPTVE